jgi:mono/diheme cytochrome c family protein
MRAAIVLIMVALGSAGVAAQDDAAKIEKGKQVYAAQKCMICHSIAGKGNKQYPLDGVGAKLSADDVRKWIVSPKEMEAKLPTKPKLSMKAYSLPAEDLDALVAYVRSLKAPATP